MPGENVKKIDNPNMHYGNKTVVGVIQPPDRINRQSAYSQIEAKESFNKLHRDVYTRTKFAPEPKKGGIPTILKITAGIAGIASIVLYGKKIGNALIKFIKNIPK